MKRAALLLACLLWASGIDSASLQAPTDEELRAAVAETLMLARIAAGTYQWSETKKRPVAPGLLR